MENVLYVGDTLMNMTTKQCGTCEFWDRANSDVIDGDRWAVCLFKNRADITVYFNNTYYHEGQDCAVYQKIKEE